MDQGHSALKHVRTIITVYNLVSTNTVNTSFPIVRTDLTGSLVFVLTRLYCVLKISVIVYG